jgi:hypothetical protein
MAFPDQRDRKLIRQAEELVTLASDLNDWMAEFSGKGRRPGSLPIPEADQFELLEQRRRAANLYNSARVPVAIAVYGPSQVGKSLFIGRVLQPLDDDYSPLGRDEVQGEPAYFPRLSFTDDLNPQSGSNEATALVTRFTTKDRTNPRILSGYPVLARGLSRAEWLCVLARGFRAECLVPETVWDDAGLEKLFSRCDPAAEGPADRGWRGDLLDAYAHTRRHDSLRLQADEPAFNGLLTRYPLSDQGYIDLAAAIFWGGWPELTALFRTVWHFLRRIAPDGQPGLLTHWAGVRFLLDSQRIPVVENALSRSFPRVVWGDFRLLEKDGWHVLDYQPGRGGGTEDLAVIQAALLELVVPILPHRLTENWRRVIEDIDLLDIPGMRAGREGAEGGARTSAQSLDERMEIVKRGKVLYLFDRYIDELQVQTLLLLARGGNLEVRGQMKSYVNRWGKARYGKDWSHRVRDDPPSLFIGLTGIDEEFRARSSFPGKELYDNRLRQLSDTLGPVLNDFGGKGVPFANVYPLRYPGTWDTTQSQRMHDGPEKWARARSGFLESALVRAHVRDSERRWDAAMDDRDGGLSLVSDGFRQCTDALGKQVELERSLEEVRSRTLRTARSWVTPADANLDGQHRKKVASRVLEWLREDGGTAYFRVHALSQSLSLRDGDAWALADFVDIRPAAVKLLTDSLEVRFAVALKGFLDDWAMAVAPERWREHIDAHQHGAPWLPLEDFLELSRLLKDYLLTDQVFGSLRDRLIRIVDLRLKDEAVRRHARRKYVRLTLNDYIMNPGPDAGRLTEVDEQGLGSLGLMRPFIGRWAGRLETCLASGAGEQVDVPPGNSELRAILASWEAEGEGSEGGG